MADILIIDDNPDILGTLGLALGKEGYTISLADSAQDAHIKLAQEVPDMILLDIMMPGQDGISFCGELRQQEAFRLVPIIFMSTLSQTDDIVRGLDAGGDDYITKPISFKELSARVRSTLRRRATVEHDDNPNKHLIEANGLQLNTHTFQVQMPTGEAIQLTSTEYRLLHYLMNNPGQAHGVHTLLDAVWHYPNGTGDPDLVRAHIRNLRQKIEDDPKNPLFIQTIHGIGYMVQA